MSTRLPTIAAVLVRSIVPGRRADEMVSDLADEYGAEAEAWYWELGRATYLRRGLDGKQSLLGDLANGGVSYYKGSWVLRMLEQVMGREAFDRGMRAYMGIPAGQPASVHEFTGTMSAAAGRDLAPFLRPWLEETTIPVLDARVDALRRSKA